MPAAKKHRWTKGAAMKDGARKTGAKDDAAKKSAAKKHRPGKDRRSWLSRVGTWLGIAGLLGVAAGGVLVARDARQRRAYTPEQVRQRLHERVGRRMGEH